MPSGPHRPTRLAVARARARMTQRTLASRAGLSRDTVGRIESGSDPARVKLETWMRLADALGCDVTDLTDAVEIA